MIYFTADWHLDKRQYGLEKREDDFYKSAYNFINKVIPDSVILNAGDIFDSNHPKVRALHELKKINNILNDKKCVMYYVEGNHDKSSPHYIDLFSTDSCYGIKLLKDGVINNIKPNVNLIGFSEQPKAELFSKIASIDINSIKDNTNILMLHASCRDFCEGFFSESAISINEIPNLNYFKYIVIGDTHVHNKIVLDNETVVMSPGSIEMVSASEDVDKSVYALNIKTGNITDLPIKTRKCVKVELKTEIDLDNFIADFINTMPKDNIIIYVTVNKEILGIGRVLKIEEDYPDVIIRVKYKSSSCVNNALIEIDENNDKVDLLTFASKYMEHCNFSDTEIVKKLLDSSCCNDYKTIVEEYLKKEIDNG